VHQILSINRKVCYNNFMEKSFFNQNEEEDSAKQNDERPRSPVKKTLAAFFEFIKTTVAVVILALAIRLFVVQPFIVEGQSMLPTFENNDYLITEKVSYTLRAPQRGEIIIFHPPDNASVNYIKRIVGLPGDQIEVKDGNVYINSQKISESYLTSDKQTQATTQNLNVKLKENEYFVLGDNRNHSRDSREIGPIPKQNIVSKIWVRLLPVDDINAFAAVNYEGLSE